MSKTIYENILENMEEGVLTVDLSGAVTTFNNASEKILSLKADNVVGKRFAEVFIMLENVDEFNQVILDTIISSKKISNKLINITVNNYNKILNVTTSFLFGNNGDKVGVIVVFSDVTQIEALKLSEKKLNEKIAEEHKKLQKAYLELEEKTESLKLMSNRLNKFKFVGVLFIFAIFLSLVYVVVKNSSPERKFFSKKASTVNNADSYVVAQQRAIIKTIGYLGSIAPLKTFNITAPYSGQIQNMYVNFGNSVFKNEKLCFIEPSEILAKLREAEISYIKQKNEYNKLKNWNNSPEVAAARRQLLMAEKTFQDSKNELIVTKNLFKKGIIPKTEYTAAIRNVENAKNALQAAKENLQNVLNVASKDNLKVAAIQLELLKDNLDKLKRDKEKGKIISPINGVLLPSSTSDGKKKILDVGTYVREGDMIFSIGDLTGFSIKISIDESDISKIKRGMKVNVIIDSLKSYLKNGEILRGKISSLSLVPSNSADRSSMPTYEAIIVLKNIPSNLKNKILLGMSAKTEIILYKNNSAVTIPVDCVGEDNGEFYVIKNINGKSIKTKVIIGNSGERWVEILKGLKPGEKVKRL